MRRSLIRSAVLWIVTGGIMLAIGSWLMGQRSGPDYGEGNPRYTTGPTIEELFQKAGVDPSDQIDTTK